MSNIMGLELPLPNFKLSTNKSKGMHWGYTNKAKNSDIDIGYYYCKQYINNNPVVFNKNDKLKYTIIFYTEKSNRDWDNMVSSFKAMSDGIFRALELNDGHVEEAVIIKRKDKYNPRVCITLEVLPI